MANFFAPTDGYVEPSFASRQWSELTVQFDGARPDQTTSIRRKRARWHPRLTHRWLLIGILVLQAGLSVRLLWANTAFGDEALYLWAGHLEWSHWLHGTGSGTLTNLPTWFSGAPVIYPPLGAVADSLGGLTAARLLSLVFMLGASLLLYDTARRLLDPRAALLGALVFVTLAPTQSLGVFATYDPMAIFLLALSTWMGVVAAYKLRYGFVPLLLLSGLVLALADATKYATLLWSPCVILVIGTAAWRSARLRTGIKAALLVAGAWIGALAIAAELAGPLYWHGILFTTLHRSSSTVSAPVVFHLAISYIWPALILGLLALIASLGQELSLRCLCTVCLGAALLAPANQARIHTTTSLYKHTDFGAWFAALSAGYLLARISRIDSRPSWRFTIATVGTCAVLFGSSFNGASHLSSFWPNSSGMIAALRPDVTTTTGPILMEEFDVGYYYLHDQVYPGQISNMFGYLTWDDVKHVELSGTRALDYAISKRYFSVVEIDGQNIPLVMADSVNAALRKSAGYRLIYSHPFLYDRRPERIEVWKRVNA